MQEGKTIENMLYISLKRSYECVGMLQLQMQSLNLTFLLTIFRLTLRSFSPVKVFVFLYLRASVFQLSLHGGLMKLTLMICVIHHHVHPVCISIC